MIKTILICIVFIIVSAMTYVFLNEGHKALMTQEQFNYYVDRQIKGDTEKICEMVVKHSDAAIKECNNLNYRLEEIDRRLEKISNAILSMNQKKTCEGDNGKRVVEIKDRMGEYLGSNWYGCGWSVR